MGYYDLLKEADNAGLLVKEKPLQAHDGLISGRRIAIRKDIPTQVQKTTVLAEELGHYYTTTGNILDQTDISSRKQERQARIWAYDKLIGLSGIIRGFEAGCQTRYEPAEYLGVTEEFLQEAIDCYEAKYGPYVKIDGYMIMFTPGLGVMKKL